MMKYLIYIFLFIGLIACSNEQPKPQKEITPQKIKQEPVVEQAPQKPEHELITDDNVVEKLTVYGKANPETIVMVYTSKGKIKIKLYEDTPLHRANFILMAKSGYFKHCLFSRVVKGFMAQCGGSYDELQRSIQDTIGKFTIPAEMSHNHFHKKGAVGAARSYTNNPDKRSACDEFYFVEGMKFSDISLDHYEEENHYTYTSTQRNYYKHYPGAAHIDGEHTVFGEIIEGYNVVPKLTHVDKDSQDWPIVDIYVDSVVVIK